MKKRAILTEILIWTVIFFVIFTCGIFIYSKIFVEPNIYNIQFKDIDGITKGSPVRFMGINIGYVRELKPKDKSINVQIIVTKKDMKIPNGTTARVEFYGLGGSKSIELMPSSDSGNGIVTGKTIRIADVIRETEGIVQIIEFIDKYLQNINSKETLEEIKKLKELNPNSIIETGNELTKTGKEISGKINKIKENEKDAIESIQEANNVIEKINKFIKK